MDPVRGSLPKFSEMQAVDRDLKIPSPAIAEPLSFTAKLIGQGGLHPTDIALLDAFLCEIPKKIFTGNLTEIEGSKIAENLIIFKTHIAAKSNKTMYALQGFDEEENQTHIGLTDMQWNNLNFVINLLDNPVPDEVRKHPGYCSNTFTLGMLTLPVEELKETDLSERALKNVGHMLRAGKNIYPNKGVYLLRPSTTRRGTAEAQAFTLSLINMAGEEKHFRLVYKPYTWVFLNNDGSHTHPHKTLDEMIQSIMKEHQAIGENVKHERGFIGFEAIGSDTKKMVHLSLREQLIEVNSFLIRGFIELCRDFLEENTNGPIPLPDDMCKYPELVKSLIDCIQFNRPVDTIPKAQLKKALKIASQMRSDYLCNPLMNRILQTHVAYREDITTDSETRDALAPAPAGTLLIRASGALLGDYHIYYKTQDDIKHLLLRVTREGGLKLATEEQTTVFQNLEQALNKNIDGYCKKIDIVI